MDNETHKDIMQSILSLCAVVGFLGTLWMLHQHEIQQSARDIIMVLTGVLAGIVKEVYGYFFGSSRGTNGNALPK